MSLAFFTVPCRSGDGNRALVCPPPPPPPPIEEEPFPAGSFVVALGETPTLEPRSR